MDHTFFNFFCLPTWVSATKDAQRLFALNTLNFYTPKKKLNFDQKKVLKHYQRYKEENTVLNEENLKQNDENAPNETGALGTFYIGRDKPGKKCVKLSIPVPSQPKLTTDHL